MLNKIEKVLISEEQIRNRIAEMGEELTRDYEGKNPVVVGVLKGVVVFYADMVRQLKTQCEMAFMTLRSYSGTNTTGNMSVFCDSILKLISYHSISEFIIIFACC